MATPTTLPASFTSGQVLTAAQMNNLRGAFRILTVNNIGKSDTATLASQTYTDITGLSLTITPQSSTSQFLVVAMLSSSTTVNSSANFQVLRNSTAIGIGDAASNRFRTSFARYGDAPQSGPIVVLDAPATASAVTYKIQWRASDPGQTIYLNRSVDDGDNNTRSRAYSSLTVLEVSA